MITNYFKNYANDKKKYICMDVKAEDSGERFLK